MTQTTDDVRPADEPQPGVAIQPTRDRGDPALPAPDRRLRPSAWPRALRDLAVPSAVYLVVYAVMNPHAWKGFSHHFLLDSYDGYQNVWNVWWVHHSLVDLHTNPYFTRLLHWPGGVTLVPQTMSPLNGLVGIGLQAFGVGLAATVNTIVIGSFVATGLTTFWLLRHLRASWSAALLGGLLFTFSSFHTAQAMAHLQLISLECMPLFVLAWLRYLERSTHGRALAAAGVLFAVILCDYYYAFYCVAIAMILLAAHGVSARRAHERTALRPLATFTAATAVTSGALIVALLETNQRDALLGAHRPIYYGLDPVALVVPGGALYWHSLTTGYWHRLLPISISETSVYLGSVLLIGLVLAIVLRRRWQLTANPAWWCALAIFGTLALGPRLHFDGVLHPSIPLPYALLERVVPGFKLSGMPVRMTVVVVLAAVVIVTEVVTALQSRLRRPALQWLLVVVLAAVSVVELYPRRAPQSPTAYPAYVAVLRRLPHDVGLIDTVSSSGSALYDQTGDGMPIAYGYVSRLPRSAYWHDRVITAALRADRYQELCTQFRLRYLLTGGRRAGLRVVYHSSGAHAVWIYDLQRHTACDHAHGAGAATGAGATAAVSPSVSRSRAYAATATQSVPITKK